MNESEFERELGALYTEKLCFADEADFASRLEKRLRLSRIRRVALLSACAGSGAGLTLVSLSAIGWLAPLHDMLSLAFGSNTGDAFWLFTAAALLLIPSLLRALMQTDR